MKKVSGILLIAIITLSGNIYSQTNQKKMTNREVVEKFLNGFNETEKIHESLALLAEDYHFKNPMVALKSKVEFIALAQEIGKVLTGVEVLRVAETDDWVAAMYIFKSSIPGVESNVATEWFRLEGGIIQESHLIYDASEWRKIYASMEK
ncbi:hypothetical protein BFP97_03025 [Roseivirga sp. 4D4]|uniref:nuclear transport factor 2 family protein n=1 Tax=Roseivirga sp. 4D4 TaxID=1889784 RepID=UPI000852C358|nr:nuclear transport factor 2 family protein [Roseivirga sp. 4D4]OEK00540.1 hypothetical protein BFP97_03025 [Roseivirga sp. 4D4]